mmetsp:Transcript_32510/g.67801  ORF Transcript_32510/g.67801 Transcript_32510/m.67801 type:complete len:205 (-) Transcript_32510:193-807(-)|eukprot:CAMPEP_0172458900 /NCGR_PEP_ID=MMETSP1065-20121228/29955_1 /TAXON_ID=265537 /ORGANISM="Amphiprora paludosa, Strain CCMP125" /LENGTH=204 /DNA_ID=CAMNT_0013213369 /DNA_START=96 /DNA_END=710 /DNA_ORIENTATION=+
MGFFGKKKQAAAAVEPEKPVAETKPAPVVEEPTPEPEPVKAPTPPPVEESPAEPAPTSEVRDAPAEQTSSSAPVPEPTEEEVDEEAEAAQEWDEGGPSHCGYHETVHETLMAVGASVHSLVGDPPENVNSGMKQVGNWFQEASYATRDFVRGDQEVNDDAGDTLSTMKANLTEIMTGSPTNADGSSSEEKKAGEAPQGATTQTS